MMRATGMLPPAVVPDCRCPKRYCPTSAPPTVQACSEPDQGPLAPPVLIPLTPPCTIKSAVQASLLHSEPIDGGRGGAATGWCTGSRVQREPCHRAHLCGTPMPAPGP